MPAKNLRDGTIKVQVDNDGGGNAGEVEVTLDNGDLNWTESRPVEMISDRGTLDHARRAVQDQLVELTFSVMYQDHLDPNSAVPTVYEALTRQGAAALWVSQNLGDSDDYSVNLEFVVTDPAGGSDEEINFDLFNITNIDFEEGDPTNQLTITGTAPLYWVDFWWRAADGLSPSIGEHGIFTRAGTATYINSDGEVDYARSGEFRSRHHPASGGGRTGLLEAQRTNTATMSEELGGADWAATNVTVTDDNAIGPDGFTTAEKLTATAANATLINDLGAIGATDQVFSIWLKRAVGTGDIDLTVNGGGAWTTVAITTSWARYSITLSLADPDVGIRIVADTDIIDAWGAQVEPATFASSYIPTTVYPLSPDGYLEFSGAAGNYASTPDAAVLDITGDIDLRARVSLDDWTPATNMALVAKWTGAAQESYMLRVDPAGTLRLLWTTDGSAGTVIAVISSVATGFTDGTIHWVRGTLDVSTGNVNFYTSDDGENWTLLGAADQGGAGATSIFSSTALLELGAYNVGATDPLAGKIYRAQVYDGIAGTLVFDADPQDTSTHGATRSTLTEKENSAVVTTFATSASATRVADNLYFPLPEVINTPKETTFYVDHIEGGAVVLPTTARLLSIARADPRIFFFQSSGGGVYGFAYRNTGGSQEDSTNAAAPTIGQRNEVRGTFSSAGVVQSHQSIAGGAEASAAAGSPLALEAAWEEDLLWVNSNATSQTGFNSFLAIIVTRRTRTLEHLRKVG